MEVIHPANVCIGNSTMSASHDHAIATEGCLLEVYQHLEVFGSGVEPTNHLLLIFAAQYICYR